MPKRTSQKTTTPNKTTMKTTRLKVPRKTAMKRIRMARLKSLREKRRKTEKRKTTIESPIWERDEVLMVKGYGVSAYIQKVFFPPRDLLTLAQPTDRKCVLSASVSKESWTLDIITI